MPHKMPHVSGDGAFFMASIQKVTKGYRAQVKTLGVRDSAVFSTKREAVLWAAQRETVIKDNAGKPAGELHSLRDALRRYSKEVSPHKRGARWEQLKCHGLISPYSL